MIKIFAWAQTALIVAAAGAAALAWAYTKGRSDAEAACRAAELQAEIDTMKRDLAAWKAADEVERMLNGDIAAERDRLAREIEDYERDLAARPDGRCLLSPDDIGRLPKP